MDDVLKEARLHLERGLNQGDIALLRKAQADKQLPDDERVWELLDVWRLLPYPNDSEWYYPHPLLTLGLLKPPSG